jgi:uncharacterized protein DUF6190
MDADIVIDAALFMGMNAEDEVIRVACKSFFVAHLDTPMVMPLEQVGRCDDLIWRLPRAVQDAYYPFMDNLHSMLRLQRLGYSRGDTGFAFQTAALDGLPDHEHLLLGFVMNRGGTLHTVSPRLLARAGLPVHPPDKADLAAAFPARLEQLYQDSLKLRVPSAEL